MTSRSSSRSPSPTTTSTVVETPASQSQINSHLRDHACVACARRKVKCDKVDPTCSNCRKSRQPCIYTEPQPRKPRKRAADGDLLARIARYEDLMRQNGVDYAPYANVWVPSGLEKEQNEQDEVEQPPRGRHDRTAVLQSQAAPVRSLWHDLPHEVSRHYSPSISASLTDWTAQVSTSANVAGTRRPSTAPNTVTAIHRHRRSHWQRSQSRLTSPGTSSELCPVATIRRPSQPINKNCACADIAAKGARSQRQSRCHTVVLACPLVCHLHTVRDIHVAK